MGTERGFLLKVKLNVVLFAVNKLSLKNIYFLKLKPRRQDFGVTRIKHRVQRRMISVDNFLVFL